MKHNEILVIVLTLLFNSCLSQEYNENVAKTDQERREELIYDITPSINTFLAKGQIDLAEEYLLKRLMKCEELEDKDLCVAGINFTGGYNYQKASLQDNTNRQDYQVKAAEYYEKVLDQYPDNKASLNNLIKLNESLGKNVSTISRLEDLAKQFPKERVNSYVKIGDLYKSDKEFDNACQYYKKAYEEDPFSKQACGAMVELYSINNVPCTLDTDIRDFALYCHEIDFPKFSEELLRKELISAFNDENYTKAKESLILWANVLASNASLDHGQVDRLNMGLLPNSEQTAGAGIRTAITELSDILKAKDVNSMLSKVKFWDNGNPVVRLSGDWTKIQPISVLLKVIYEKGKEAYLTGNTRIAIPYWKEVLSRSERINPDLFVDVAADLASIYSKDPAFNINSGQFNSLINRLFNRKTQSYLAGNKSMIRKLHLTLGSIYYDEKVWSRKESRHRFMNALFQLEHALDEEKLGPIVNPKLRQMLGDVYIEISKYPENVDRLKDLSKAVNSYSLSIMEYLSLDKLRVAHNLHSEVLERYYNKMDIKQKESIKSIGSIINWRKQMADSNNALVNGEITIKDFLEEVTKAEKNASTSLPMDFVKVQFFKGLSDLGSNLPDKRKVEKQLIYSNALNRLKTTNDLPSTRDFNRIKGIKITLEESVEQSRELKTIQMNKNASSIYDRENNANSRVFNVSTFNKNISVPIQLFTLNERLQDDYKKTNTTGLIKYKLNKGNFELKTKDNN